MPALGGAAPGPDGVARATRLEPPRRRHRPEHRQPGDRRQGDVEPDELGRELQGPLDAAHDALQGEQAQDRQRGASAPACRLPGAEQEPDGDRRQAEDGGDRRVALDDPLQRAGALEVEAVDELALVGAGVGPGAGRDRPGEDRQLAERDQRPHRPDAEPVAGGAPLARLVARAPGEGEGGVEQQHREDEVAHHQPRCEVVLDDQRAEDRLAEHAQRQQRPEERPGARGRACGRRPRPAAAITARPTKPVSSRLPYSITAWVSSGGTRAAVALGPVRAAEARAGEPHAGAGEDDQRQRREGDQRHLRVELGRDAELSRSRIGMTG